MTAAYFYNDISGEEKVFDPIPGLTSFAWPEYEAFEAALHAGISWHKYASQAELDAALKTHPNWPQPTKSIAGGVGNVAGKAASAATGSITDFLSRLASGATWLRVAESVLGLVLIAIGLARITHAVPIATKVAKTAGAVALV